MSRARHVACERQERCIQGFGWTPGGERSYGRPRCRWDANIKMDPQKLGWGDKDWIDVAERTFGFRKI